MLTIEQCLDRLLLQLESNWDRQDRIPLNADDFLKEIGYPARHEFFNTLVEKLLRDGYAMISEDGKDYPDTRTKYQARTIITIDGYYFIKTGKSFVEEKKIKENEPEKQYKRDLIKVLSGAIAGALLTAALSGILTWMLRPDPQQPQPNTVVLPKIQIVHDTVYVSNADSLK